jgi:hypothetical protein
MITDKELHNKMSVLAVQYDKGLINVKKLIANAVTLGMMYQEEKIKEGINIVFKELHNK